MEYLGFKIKVKGTITRTYYVYEYSVNGEPFYIGKGSRDSKSPRYLAHFRMKGRANSFFMRKLLKLRAAGDTITVRIVYCTYLESRALRKECSLISKYGRRAEGGTLCNLTLGGDGGDTYNGRCLYHCPQTQETKAFRKGKAPRGWVQGYAKREQPRIVCHNPLTRELTRVYRVEDIPKGFLRGSLKGLGTGPKNKMIISNRQLNESRWVGKDLPVPRGWEPGRLNGPTNGRTAYYNPITQKKCYVPKGKAPPKGYVKGQPPTTGQPVKIGKRRFESIQSAMTHFDIPRYKLLREYDVQFL